ncbi:MAG: NTPase [Candidatus Hadarchaeales archaeon]
MPVKNFLVTGAPGSGKSTVIARAVEILRLKGMKAAGIVCPEIRDGAVRVGFRMVNISTGESAVLAHIGIRDGPSVGRYGVNLAGIDLMSRTAIEEMLPGSDFVVIDEIGPMEIASERFRKAVLAALDSGKPVIAAVHMMTKGGFIGSVKSRSDVRIFSVNASNRDTLPHEISGCVEKVLGGI